MCDEKRDRKKHFVLVHGFGHGAWCWYKLLSTLRSNGQHRVTALDLAGCGVHPKQLHQISSFSDYVQPLMEFMSGLPDDERAILVGHSYGGFPISLAMERFPGKVSLAVYVTAYMPNCMDLPGTLIQEFFKWNSTKSFMDSEFEFDESGNEMISGAMGPDYIAAKLYEHCTIEDVELGKMLIRPNLFFTNELSREPSLLSEEGYGKVKRCYIVCEGDEVMDEEFQRRYNVEKSPPDDVITIAGAAHMVMLTKPQELCSALLSLAQKY